MLKQIRDELIADIKTALPNIERVEKYRGELEENSDWNPPDTACFIQIIGYKPRVKAADNTILKKSLTVKIYAGANYKHDKDALDIIEALIDLFAGGTLTVSGTKYNLVVSDEGMDLILYEKGFEGYAFILLIQ